MWLLKKVVSSREEPDISLSIVDSKAVKDTCILTLCTHIISLKCGSMLNTRSNDFIRRYIEHMTSCTRKKLLWESL